MLNISQKISSKEEKKRLERLVYSILPKNYGAIIRTAAEGKKAAVLDAELRSLISKWEDSFEAIANGKPPKLLFNERSRTTTILRDLLNDSFTNIVVNDKEVYQEILSYISTIMPDQKDIVKYYKGNTPIFDAYDLTKQIKGSFGKVVPIKQGATGVYTFQPQNINGNWRATIGNTLSLSLGSSQMWFLDNNVNFTYNRNVDFVTMSETDMSVRNKVDNLYLAEKIRPFLVL